LYTEGHNQPIQLINFDKHVKSAKIIAEVQRFQIAYDFLEIAAFQNWIDAQLQRIRSTPAGDVAALYRRSLLLEPRRDSKV